MAGTFINPYTFIPIEEEGTKKDLNEYLKGNNLTGKLICKIMTKTPLSIPDLPKDDKADHKKYPFFRVDSRAVIPGSSIRGVIRSSYEALTNSCMHTDDDYFYSSGSIKNPGILKKENGKYVLYEATRYIAKKVDDKRLTDDYKTGDIVKFDFTEGKKYTCGIVTKIGTSCSKQGVVLKMNTIILRNSESNPSIFEKKQKINPSIDTKFIDRLAENVKMYVKNEKESKGGKEGRGAEYKKCFETLEHGGIVPVWFSKENQNYYFAPAQMSRSVYIKKPSDFLKEKNLKQCENKKKVCETCALFGFISSNPDKKNNGIASRVRFSDAVCDEQNCFDGFKELPILSSPRLSSFEFYLKNSSNRYSADSNGTMISGRKAYWHNKDFNYKSLNLPDEKNKNMNATVETISPGTVFSAEVYFNKITTEELHKLIFSLNLGENKIDSNQCLKMGHGKPVGLGSVKIIVESVITREFEDYNYSTIEDNSYIENATRDIFKNESRLTNILKVTNFNEVDGKLISYPQFEGKEEIFEWFSKNRNIFNKDKGSTEYKNKLPTLTSLNQELTMTPDSTKPTEATKKNQKKSEEVNRSHSFKFIGYNAYECICSICGKKDEIDYSTYKNLEKNNKKFQCQTCRDKRKLLKQQEGENV